MVKITKRTHLLCINSSSSAFSLRVFWIFWLMNALLTSSNLHWYSRSLPTHATRLRGSKHSSYSKVNDQERKQPKFVSQPQLLHQMSHVMRITCLCHMRTTKAQISLRIRAVWSTPLLFAAWIVLYLFLLYTIFQISSKSLWLSRPVWVLPDRNPEGRFSHDAAKRPRGREVSAPDFGSRGRGFESRWRRPEPKWRFIAESLSYSPLNRLEMTEILLKGP